MLYATILADFFYKFFCIFITVKFIYTKSTFYCNWNVNFSHFFYTINNYLWCFHKTCSKCPFLHSLRWTAHLPIIMIKRLDLFHHNPFFLLIHNNVLIYLDHFLPIIIPMVFLLD